MLVSTIALIALISKILTVIPGIPYKTGFKNIAENWKIANLNLWFKKDNGFDKVLF